MKLYYVNRNPNQIGNHELHLATCNHLPNIFNRVCLGDYKTPHEALHDAKKIYPSATVCNTCLENHNEKIKPIPFYKKWFRKK
ncbi:hypothetical protein [Flavobacterium capsici]|uniref:Uncharacterized protein n=1 Tax=Flavobacterium capsici TaxID=3075618 RepID=A0AA96EXN2_9FLAO|nr:MULTISPECIES: hypothetical protein [unclassified Flavobacterium]WNM19133.1 hypothetical protein RN608_00270 [Flavobacterium sp. PMR2A8]WNM20522.1 hypothetical protein RN605_07440 [Flavobacterium sp. PMTSA4]